MFIGVRNAEILFAWIVSINTGVATRDFVRTALQKDISAKVAGSGMVRRASVLSNALFMKTLHHRQDARYVIELTAGLGWVTRLGIKLLMMLIVLIYSMV